MKWEFRTYRQSDLEAVMAIFRSNIPKYFGPDEEAELRRFLADSRSGDYFVLELNGQVVGSGGIALNADETISLSWGMVRNDLIGTGLGKKLTEFRIIRARERFAPLPIVISTSQHTKGFYEKFGFELTEQIPNGFGPGIDICKMRLEGY